MKALTIRSFAKINLGLRVLGRRPDGYHDIHTTLQAIDLCDLLTFEQGSGLSLAVEGRYAVACDASNLVMRAAKAMSELCPGRGAKITLRKEIPPGSGLGGGSSNAAVTLLALDRLWGAGLQPAARLELARSLG
ncbi:MAG: 4-(cytidine 5'-diphospho)-2-C-methyl-D-erythritol kinase, partial [Acidobacteriota bacterium]